ncbi:MAG: M48 family metallopeptidase [Myxococcota bacterium]
MDGTDRDPETADGGQGVDQATRRALLDRLERDAQRLCARFGLRYRVLEAERANVKRRYGVCFSDGTIRIRLRHATTGRALKYSSLVNTLCHELAHLQHFNHGPRFQAFYGRILEYARGQGIYRPDTPGRRDDSDASTAPLPLARLRRTTAAGARRATAEASPSARPPAAQLELFASASRNREPGPSSSAARATQRATQKEER